MAMVTMKKVKLPLVLNKHHTMKTRGGMEIDLHSFLTAAIYAGECQLHAGRGVLQPTERIRVDSKRDKKEHLVAARFPANARSSFLQGPDDSEDAGMLSNKSLG
jgi:hypothetical protein